MDSSAGFPGAGSLCAASCLAIVEDGLGNEAGYGGIDSRLFLLHLLRYLPADRICIQRYG